jgi:hypothetical protein
MSSNPDDRVAPLKRPAVVVHKPLPQVEIHLRGVQEALRDGRLTIGAFAEWASVSERTVRAWLDDEPIGYTFDARVWAAAVTTAIPGWPSPRAAMRASPASPPAAEDAPQSRSLDEP